MFSKKETENKEVQVDDEKRKLLIKKASVFVVHYFDALVAALVLIIFVAGFFFIINPKYKAITETEQYSLEDLQSGNTKLSNYLAKLIEYKNAYQKLSDVSRERLEKVAPQDQHLENFFAQIENITKRQGVSIFSLSVSELIDAKETNPDGTVNTAAVNALKDSGLGKVKIELAVNGADYMGAKRLLSVFENNLRLMDVQSVKFDTTSKKVEFVITSYFLK